MKFRSIGVITKPNAESARETLLSLLGYLNGKGCKVILDEQITDDLNQHGFKRADRNTIGAECDLAIVVGGDGTILNAVRSLVHANVPLLGINVGRLGFLADISPDALEKSLDDILDGSYHEDQRLLLEMKVNRDDKIIFEGDAFNNVVVHISDVARMIEYETRIDDEIFNHQPPDGIVD